MQNKKNGFTQYIVLHLLMLFFSLSPICSKMAGKYAFMSSGFMFFYGCVLFILFIYAIFWQKIIRRMPLTVAYANKAITVVWGMLWGALLFNETITLQKLVGALVIVAGILLFVLSDSPKSEVSQRE